MFEVIFSLNTVWWVCMIAWFPACAGLIVIVLLQKGKGAGFAGAFGTGGGSDAVFGPRSRKSLPVKLTYYMAATFMVLSLFLSLIVGRISTGIAPEEVDENTAAAATDRALDDLFGEAPAGESQSSDAAGVRIATTPEAEPAAAEAAAESAPAPDAAAADESASAPAETAPAAQ